MNDSTTVALCESNKAHWFRLQVTGCPAAFSLLQPAAADHWAYNRKLLSCVIVAPASCTESMAGHRRETWHVQTYPLLRSLGLPL